MLEFCRLVQALEPPAPVRCIIAVNDTNGTFRFHQIRPGESWNSPGLDAVPLENRIRLLALSLPERQAARLYSLIRPFSMGFRRIRWTSRLAASPRGTSRSEPGTRWAMP